jgi:DNA-binding MarR family transcriptional regulator
MFALPGTPQADLAARASAWLDGYRRRERVSAKLSEGEWRILLALAVEGDATVYSLALASGRPATTGLRYVSGLERRGWIVAAPHPEDGRSRVLTLTDAGRAVLEQAA